MVLSASKKREKLKIEGMTCNNCAAGISRYLEKKGLEDVTVNFSTGEARFSFTDDNPEILADIKKGVERLGYHVMDENQHASKTTLSLEKKFYISLFFTTPLLLHMFLPLHFLSNSYFQLALCLPVFFIGVIHFGKSALGSLKTGIPNMDVLIILGTSAAFFYSLAGTVFNLGPDFLFYETSATIITLVLLGNIIEHRSVKQTTLAIEELGKLQASKAKLVWYDPAGNEKIKEVEAKNIVREDILLVNTGDRVPFDGSIVWGNCSIDESMITGESLPVEKNENDKVTGGTLLSKGSIKIKVEATGEDTYLANIIELVKSAQQRKPDIQRLADKISAYFVPIVVMITLFTFFISFFWVEIPFQKALLNSVAILVIACPCAMGLATPTAVMVGIGRVTKKGILIKGGKTLEQLASIRQIVFDKTGTLTTGQFKIKKITSPNEDIDQIKSILASVEKHSSHPIANSISRELKGAKEIKLKNIQELMGIGMKAEDENGNQFELGSYQIAKGLTDETEHDLFLLRNQELIATIDIQDELKPGAKSTIEYLKKKGIKTILLSGDNKAKCTYVAQELGIDDFYYGKLPDEKLKLVEELTDHMPTAMVGDGINDAPALAKATVGISLSNATEVAIDSSQVILLNGNLEHLKSALELSNQTLTTIKQNLFWAFSYNIVAIPIAALGFLNPMIAAFSMAFSDVMVIGNSLRLKTKPLK